MRRVLDSGVLTIFTQENTAAPGMMPVFTFTKRSEHFYEERTVGVSRFYTALQANQHIDMVARIWQDRGIETVQRCEAGGQKYLIRQVQHTTDKDGLPVTDLALERMDADDLE